MGRVLVRDQYQSERWIDEAQLPYRPWRDCEVIRYEYGGEGGQAVDPAPESAAEVSGGGKAASKTRKPAAE